MAELPARYEAYSGNIQAWEKALRKAKNDAALMAVFHQEIGQLKVERNFLSEGLGSRVHGGGERWWIRGHQTLSLVRQCALLGVNRSMGVSEKVLFLMREMDRQYLVTPFNESRR